MQQLLKRYKYLFIFVTFVVTITSVEVFADSAKSNAYIYFLQQLKVNESNSDTLATIHLNPNRPSQQRPTTARPVFITKPTLPSLPPPATSLPVLTVSQYPCQWSKNTVCNTALYQPLCVTNLNCIFIVRNKCVLDKLNCGCQIYHTLSSSFCNYFGDPNYQRCNIKLFIE